MTEVGPDGEIVVSTRCRLARNVDGFPFPWRADELQRRRVRQMIVDAACRSGGALSRAQVIAPAGLEQDDVADLLAWRYISRDWASGGTSRRLLVASDRATSLMVNEEDHVRLQVIHPGLLVESVVDAAHDEERLLAEWLAFASDPEIGYLTTSPVNAGAGIRVSVLLHLVGLAATSALHETLEAAATIGSSVRGAYGEGTPGTGGLFQVSNTCSYGDGPREIADRVAATARYLVDAERRARAELFCGEAGRHSLQRAAFAAVQDVFESDLPADRLLPTVSLLRLAVAQGALEGNLADTAEWIAVAGLAAAQVRVAGSESARYEAVRRGAALRQQLRRLAREALGTPPTI